MEEDTGRRVPRAVTCAGGEKTYSLDKHVERVKATEKDFEGGAAAVEAAIRHGEPSHALIDDLRERHAAKRTRKAG